MRIKEQIYIDPTLKPFYSELQSLRGLAALSVVWAHAFGCVTPLKPYRWNALLPTSFSEAFHLFDLVLFVPFNGHNAVVFFFILSGFVLSSTLSRRIEQKNQSPLKILCNYTISRFFKIVPAASFVALISGIILMHSSFSLYKNYGAEWLRLIQPSWHDVQQTAITLNDTLSPAYWTLRVELVDSLLLFFLYVFVIRRITLSLQFIMSAILLSMSFVFFPVLWLRYLFCFWLGAMAYHYFKKNNSPHWITTKILYLALGMLMLGPLFSSQIFSSEDSTLFFRIICESFGSTILILWVVSQSTHRCNYILRNPYLLQIGKISYSFYLCHFIILQIIFVWLAKWAGSEFLGSTFFTHLFLAIITLLITWPFSTLFYNIIEKPSVNFGKFLVDRFNGTPIA